MQENILSTYTPAEVQHLRDLARLLDVNLGDIQDLDLAATLGRVMATVVLPGAASESEDATSASTSALSVELESTLGLTLATMSKYVVKFEVWIGEDLLVWACFSVMLCKISVKPRYTT